MRRVDLVLTALTAAALMLGGCTRESGTLSASPTTPAPASPAGSSSPPSPTPDPATSSGGTTRGGTPGGAPTPTGPSTFVINPTASGPTDDLPANTIVGTVTTTTTGPCYLIETDDGNQYALYGSGGAVNRGQRVKALTAPMTASVDCGPGVQLRLIKLES